MLNENACPAAGVSAVPFYADDEGVWSGSPATARAVWQDILASGIAEGGAG